jgi:DNA polymerase-3 subunit delta
LLQTELHRVVDSFVQDNGDMALERLDGETAAFERIQEALTSMPFLASNKLVVLDTPGSNKQFAEKFADLIKDMPETTDVLIVEPKLDKRSSYYKQLKKLTDYKEFGDLDEVSLAKWLVGQVKNQGGALSGADAQFLINRLGTNQQLLSNELDKLLMFDKQVTRQSIEELSEPLPQSTVFELVDAAFAGRLPQALKLYDDQRAQKVEPQAILAMLVWQLHVLAVVKAAGAKNPQDIASQAKINPFVVRKTQGIARNVSLADLKKRIHDVLMVDVRLKSESIDADEALRALLVSMSG